MPKVLVKRSHCLGGGFDVWEGQVIELDENEAARKVALGWVVPVSDATPAAAPAVEPEPDSGAAGAGQQQPPEPDESGAKKSKSR